MSVATAQRPAKATQRSFGVGPAGSRAAERLIDEARRCIAVASIATDPSECYAAAHLGALRAAAAVLAERAHPAATTRRSRRPTSAWELLTRNAPELTEWAGYFASGAGKRAAAQAGLRGAVSAREADDLIRDVEIFLGVVEARLGMLPADVRSTELRCAIR